MVPATLKDSLRQQLIAARMDISDAEWSENDAKRSRITLDLLSQRRPGVLAIYASRPHEPSTSEIITGAVEEGWRVLLPAISKHVAWAQFTGWDDMAPGWEGIPQPQGQQLPAAVLSTATMIITSALAVSLDGTRLGTGGGWYDHALPHRRSGTAVWALTRAVEVMDTLPRMNHDVTVNGVVTEVGFRPLG